VAATATSTTAASTTIEITQANFAPAATGSSRFEKLLGYLPDNPETRADVWMDDLAAVRVSTHLSALGANPSRQAAMQYVITILGINPGQPGEYAGNPPRTFVPPGIDERRQGALLKGPAPLTQFRNDLGFDLQDVDQYVTAGGSTVDPAAGTTYQPSLDVYVGANIDRERVAAALKACSDCVPYTQKTDRPTSTYYAWPSDLKYRNAGPLFNQAGTGRRARSR